MKLKFDLLLNGTIRGPIGARSIHGDLFSILWLITVDCCDEASDAVPWSLVVQRWVERYFHEIVVLVPCTSPLHRRRRGTSTDLCHHLGC